MKARFAIAVFFLISTYILCHYTYLFACSSGCNAWSIGAVGMDYLYGAWDCPTEGDDHSDCSGMLSNHLYLGYHKTATQFYNTSVSSSYEDAEFLYNSSPHVTVVRGGSGDEVLLSNCSPVNDCYNTVKTEAECEEFYGLPRSCQ